MTTATGHTSAITAKRVIGTDVRDATGDKVGKVEDIVLNKESNDILFAVVGFGGFLGMGEKFHPVPWSMLDYDPSTNAYRTSITEAQLKAAPADTIEALTEGDGQQWRDKTYDYYGAPRYWS